MSNLRLACVVVSAVAVLGVSGCDGEQKPFAYGTDSVRASDGWVFDKVHSSVRWETAYLGVGALITGRFNNFAITANFVEDKPEETTITARVTLSSVNTGEPGRDGGCLQATFGTNVSDEAVFTSNKVELDGSGGYLVEGTLRFHGKESPALMKLRYYGTAHVTDTPNSFYVAGFGAEFDFLAKSQHDIVSNQIGDLVTVKVEAQFRKSG